MASLKVRDILANLEKKGFAKDESRDHIWLNYLSTEGKKTAIRTKVSHGEDEIGNPLISKMAKQVRLSNTDFISLVSCTLSGEEYYHKVKNYM